MTIEKMMTGRVWRFLGAIAATAALAACGGGGSGDAAGTPSAGTGSLRVALTDAPSCGYDHVYVTIEKVRVHQSGTAADADAGWTELTLSPARRVDLLELTNGVLEELGTVPLPAGQYSQIRLVLASNTDTGTATFANAVQPTGGDLTALSTPSAQQSGLKLQAHFDVPAGQMADVVLDFDACKSIVKAGNSGKYNLKPVVAVVSRVASTVQGFVTTTLSLTSTTVSVQQNGAVVRSTTPDATGKFSIPYLPAGTYTVVISSDGRATTVITGVPAGTATTVVSAAPIAPPLSAMAEVAGTVTASTVSGSTTTTVNVTDATVSAIQGLTGGPVIALGSQQVDATAASYRLRLPVAAPVKSAYAAGSTPVFAPDTAAAGKYTVQVQAAGRASQEKPADISGGGAATVNFSYGP